MILTGWKRRSKRPCARHGRSKSKSWWSVLADGGRVSLCRDCLCGGVAVPPLPSQVGIDAQEPFHCGDEVGLGCFDDEVKMVAHEAIGMHLPVGLGAGF